MLHCNNVCIYVILNFCLLVSFVQVQQLLAAMKLEQYQAKFLEEQISGEILADLGEEELEQELGVCIRVHRLRLLKIAAGFHRAEMD